MIPKDQNLRLPAAYLKVFLQHAAAENLTAGQLLAGTGLDVDELLQSDQAVSLEQTLLVLASTTRILGPGWHLSLGPRLTIPSHGPLGFAVVTAPDLRTSVDVLLRFFGIRGPFLWLAGSVEKDQFVIRLYETTDMGAQRGAMLELAVLSLQGLLERPLGRELTGAQIAFACPAYDEAMHRYLLIRCEEELHSAMGVLPAEITVRQALLARSGVLPSLGEVAAGLHVSPRTLIRRLKAGDTSYQAILEDVRKTLATDYLLHSPMNVSSISWRLGYQDPSNFGRAFRSWFGVSPGRYRADPGSGPYS
jgi:AraC-like DNA-binding protein